MSSPPRLRLGLVVTVDTRSINPQERPEELFNYVGLGNIASKTGVLVNLTPTLGSEIGSTKYLFDERHVLYGKLRPYLNKVFVPKFDGVCTTDIIPLLPADSVDREFLAYMLRAPSVVQRTTAAMTGTKMPRARMPDLLSLEVPVPPIEEQRRVVGKLNEAFIRMDMVAEEAAQFGRVLAQLEAAWMDQALSTQLQGILDVPLGEVSGVAYGVTKNPTRSAGKAPHAYLRVANVQRGYLDLSEIKTIDVSPEELDRWRLLPDDVLICEGNSTELVGRAAIFRGEMADCVHQNHVIRVRPSARVLGDFVVAYLNSRRGQGYFRSKAKKTTNLATINSTEVRSMPIPLPTLTQQADLVGQLREVDSRVADLVSGHTIRMKLLDSTRSALLEQGFQGML